MNVIDRLFEEANEDAFRKYSEDFSVINRVHDWRNYVDKDLIAIWHELSDRERKLIFLFADRQAAAEVWS
jgi:hypothetical protein